ncbi:hypothetical protein [Bacillus sp. AFS073361]|uniref:hypothetical protein n=1 Tax=Bacillus sp. AFS073361 TaxID=2033511 RepID=UPI00359CB01C
MKRHFGYTYFLTRGLESVNTEVSFICLAYNFKRMINIIGVKELITRFRGDSPPFYMIFGIFIIFAINIVEFIKALINSTTIVRQTHVRWCERSGVSHPLLLDYQPRLEPPPPEDPPLPPRDPPPPPLPPPRDRMDRRK